MNDRDVFSLGFIVGMLFTGAVMLLLALSFFPDSKPSIICEYEGGQVQGDVCIVDGKVFDIE